MFIANSYPKWFALRQERNVSLLTERRALGGLWFYKHLTPDGANSHPCNIISPRRGQAGMPVLLVRRVLR